MKDDLSLDAAVKTLLVTGRTIWGDSETTPEDLPARLGVMTGDVSRLVRDATETSEPVDAEELAKELGNFVLSCVRWADDLGLDPTNCVEHAIAAQERYVSKDGLAPRRAPPLTEPRDPALRSLWKALDEQAAALGRSAAENGRLRRGLDWSCGLWTEHRINSRDEGYTDYRDSPPVSSLLCALGPGTLIVETSDPSDPCAHVLRYVGALPGLQAIHAELNDDDWSVWLSKWKAFVGDKDDLPEEPT